MRRSVFTFELDDCWRDQDSVLDPSDGRDQEFAEDVCRVAELAGLTVDDAGLTTESAGVTTDAAGLTADAAGAAKEVEGRVGIDQDWVVDTREGLDQDRAEDCRFVGSTAVVVGLTVAVAGVTNALDGRSVENERVVEPRVIDWVVEPFGTEKERVVEPRVIDCAVEPFGTEKERVVEPRVIDCAVEPFGIENECVLEPCVSVKDVLLPCGSTNEDAPMLMILMGRVPALKACDVPSRLPMWLIAFAAAPARLPPPP